MPIQSAAPTSAPHRHRKTTHPSDVEVSPGVIDMRDSGDVATTAQQAETLAVDNAAIASKHGTFGVGGALIGPDGKVIAVVQNHVLHNGHVVDPTAHAERQLVDWYQTQVHRGAPLPPPEQICLITSLDPCVMCTGAALTAGFHVLVGALDPFNGANYKGDGQFSALPDSLKSEAKQNFEYVGVPGERPYEGASGVPFAGWSITAGLEKRSQRVFNTSLDNVKKAINQAGDGDGVPPQDPQTLLQGAAPEVLAVLRAHDPASLTIREAPGTPGPALGQRLMQVASEAHKAGNAANAAALVDASGNVLLTVSGKEGESATRTPFMELTRTWAKIREEAGAEGRPYLPHLKNCTVVTLYGPGQATTDIMQIGAYGSTVEGPLPASDFPHWQYVIPSQDPKDLHAMVANLPPLYSQVIKPDIEQVKSPELIRACQEGLAHE